MYPRRNVARREQTTLSHIPAIATPLWKKLVGGIVPSSSDHNLVLMVNIQKAQHKQHSIALLARNLGVCRKISASAETVPCAFWKAVGSSVILIS